MQRLGASGCEVYEPKAPYLSCACLKSTLSSHQYQLVSLKVTGLICTTRLIFKWFIRCECYRQVCNVSTHARLCRTLLPCEKYRCCWSLCCLVTTFYTCCGLDHLQDHFQAFAFNRTYFLFKEMMNLYSKNTCWLLSFARLCPNRAANYAPV